MTRIAALGLLLVTAACASDSSTLSLGKDDVPDQWEERRRRMNITATEGPEGPRVELTVEELILGVLDQGVHSGDGLQAHCEQLLENPGDDGFPATCTQEYPADIMLESGGGNCREVACESQLRLCVAHTLMELADVPQFDREIGEFVVGPQDRSSQAGLHEAALHLLKENVLVTSRTMAAAAVNGGAPADTNCVPEDVQTNIYGLVDTFSSGSNNSPSNGEVLGNAFAESYFLLRDAADKAIDDNLAISDETYSVESSRTSAARIAHTAPVLSRGHAAHLALGYSPVLAEPPSSALPILNNQPLFSRERPRTDSFRAAVALIRETGLAPADIESVLTTDEIFTDRTSATSDQSVAQRLEELYGETLPTDPDEFYAYFGTTRAACEEARRVVAEELQGYQRNREMELTEPDHLDGTLSFTRYAATTLPPRGREDFWASMVIAQDPSQAVQDHIDETSFADLPYALPTNDYVRRSAAGAIDYAISMASELLGHADSLTYPRETLASFTSIISDLPDRPARIEFRFESATDLKIRVLGKNSGQIRIVRGAAGLECAVEGTVEGQPCDLDDYDVADSQSDFSLDDPTNWLGFEEGAEVQVLSGAIPLVGNIETYGIVEQIEGKDALAGGYRPIGTAPVTHELLETFPYGGAIPANPWAAEKVRSSLAPLPSNPSKSAKSCAGIVLDNQRIPLENELSEDGSGHENSWRTYLTLARQAADEADRLGEELIATGLRMDLRAEGALDVLAETCGTNIDLDWSRVSLDEDGDGVVDIDAEPCAGASPQCAEGYVCHAGYCVADPVDGLLLPSHPDGDDANLSRLRACVADAEIYPFAGLGSKQLCVWREVSNPTVVCGGDRGRDCPFYLSEMNTATVSYSSCEDIPGAVIGGGPAVEVLSVEPLNLFNSDSAGSRLGSDSRRRKLCNALRRTRVPIAGSFARALQRANDLETVERGREFDPELARLVASTISVRDKQGGYADLLRNGELWKVDLGNIVDGPNYGSWPCAMESGAAVDTPFPIACSDGDSGLGFWCRAGDLDCSNPDARRGFAVRMELAVVAARQMTGAGIGGLGIPYASVDEAYPDWRRGRPTTLDYATSDLGEFLEVRRGKVNLSGLSEDYEPSYVSIQPASGGSFSWAWDTDEIDWHVFTGPEDSAANLYYRGRNAAELFAGFQGRQHLGRLLTLEDDGVSSVRSVIYDDVDEAEAVFGRWHGVGASSHLSARDYSRYDSEIAMGLPGRLSYQNARDGLELICEAPLGSDSLASECGAPVQVTGIDDLGNLVSYMDCVADAFEQRGERMVFAEVPSDVAAALGGPEPFGVHPGAGGAYAEGLSTVRFHLRQLPSLQLSVSSQLRQFSQAMRRVELQLRAIGLGEQLQTIRLASTVSSEIAACGAALSRAGSLGALGGAAGAGVVTCANSFVQIGLAIQQAGIEAAMSEVDKQVVIADLMSGFGLAIDGIEGAALSLRESQEQIEGGLVQITNARRRAKRAVSRALFADSAGSGAVFPVNTVMRRQLNSAQARYRAAHQRAVRMAALARLALEQRLGTNLEDLSRLADSDGLTLVEDPALWADSVCRSTGIDYARLRDSRLPDASFEDMYIGSYVDRLEDVVETYRLDMPFSDGHDVSVISLRDDLLRVRGTDEECEDSLPQRNLLGDSGTFDLSSLSETAPALLDSWSIAGCADISLPDATTGVASCVALQALPENPVPEIASPSRAPVAHRLVFGGWEEAIEDAGMTSVDVDPATSSLREDTKLRQGLATEPGRRYRVSLYHRPSVPYGTATEGPTVPELVAIEADGVPVSGLAFESMAAADGWTRWWAVFDTIDGLTYELTLNPKDGSTYPPSQMADVAGFMLEDVTSEVVGASITLADHPPTLFEHADTRYAMCVDEDGGVFRAEHWTRGCERRCSAGGAVCSEELRVTRCYREARFSLELANDGARWLSSGPGFALGNYNYRTDAIAVNIIGTAVRDCEDAGGGAVCYANGSIPYSIYHDSDFTVRNHASEEYTAPLPPGRIETARALAAERYISNPISSADRAQLSDYWRRELIGRPVAGGYRIRIWEEPGVRFDRIEDVQIVLDYRYWTRLD